MTHILLHLDDVEKIHAGGAGWWRPIRRTLGVTAFGINAYTADEAGDPLIETHDETSFGAGRHEEHQLACYEALADHGEQAIEHLRIAYANNPETREWAAGDEDLANVRNDPALRR
jgi:hypothetical protein